MVEWKWIAPKEINPGKKPWNEEMKSFWHATDLPFVVIFSPTQHFVKQFVSFLISLHLHGKWWTFLWRSQRVLGCKYNKELANAWES